MKAKHILVLCLALFSIHSFAHDQLVHEAITVNAAESALNGATAFAAFIDLISADEPLKERGRTLGCWDRGFQMCRVMDCRMRFVLKRIEVAVSVLQGALHRG